MSQQRPYQEKPLSPRDRESVEDSIRGFPAGIEAVVEQLRDPGNPLGQRFAVGLGMFGIPTTAEDALIQTGNIVDDARHGTFLQARTSEDLQWSPYHQVNDFDPAEIGRVHQAIKEAKAKNGMDLTDTHFVGYIDASGERSWTLGVVDIQEHTVTTLPYESAHGH